jgi:hypothetical protein
MAADSPNRVWSDEYDPDRTFHGSLGPQHQPCVPFNWTKPAEVLITKAADKQRVIFIKIEAYSRPMKLR